MASSKITQAVIPAAGLGTRQRPWSQWIPKELMPIHNHAAIHWVLEEIAQAGFVQVILIVAASKHLLVQSVLDKDQAELPPPPAESGQWTNGLWKSPFSQQQLEVAFVVQGQPRGLGHALLMAQPYLKKEPFAVCLPDELFFSARQLNRAEVTPPGSTLQKCCELASQTLQSIVAVLEVPFECTPQYGVIALEPQADGKTFQQGRVVGAQEKPALGMAASSLALVGRYVFSPALWPYLASQEPGLRGEIQLTDSLDRLARQGEVRAVRVHDIRFDVGDGGQYVACQLAHLAPNQQWHLEKQPLQWVGTTDES